MKHIVSVVVYNNSGVLSRVSSLFGRRGFNIDSRQERLQHRFSLGRDDGRPQDLAHHDHRER